MTTFLELAKGGRRVTWKSIKAANAWYIKEKFLADGHTLENPARLSESALRAYWQLWYDLAKKGQHFAFQRVGTPADTSGGPSKPDSAGSEEEPSEDEDKARGKKRKQISPSDTTGVSTDSENGTDPEKELSSPKVCISDAEKFAFLRGLASSSDKEYQNIIALVAQMGVSVCFNVNL